MEEGLEGLRSEDDEVAQLLCLPLWVLGCGMGEKVSQMELLWTGTDNQEGDQDKFLEMVLSLTSVPLSVPSAPPPHPRSSPV